MATLHCLQQYLMKKYAKTTGFFYSERLELIWIMTSEEFDKEAGKNRTGKNIGLRSIWFNGKKIDKETGLPKEYCKPQWIKYVAPDFNRIAADAA